MSQISAFVSDPTDTFSILHDEIQRLSKELEQCRRTHVADDSVGKVKKHFKELEEANSKLQQAEAEKKKLTEALSQLNDKHESKTKLFGDLQKKLQQIEEEKQERQKELEELQTQLREEKTALQKKKTALERSLQEVSKDLAEANSKLQKEEAEKKKIETALAEATTSMEELKQHTSLHQKELSLMRDAQSELQTTKTDLMQAKTELEEAKKELKQAKEAGENAINAANKAKKLEKELEQQLGVEAAKATKLNTENKELVKALDAAKQDNTDLSQTLERNLRYRYKLREEHEQMEKKAEQFDKQKTQNKELNEKLRRREHEIQALLGQRNKTLLKIIDKQEREEKLNALEIQKQQAIERLNNLQKQKEESIKEEFAQTNVKLAKEIERLKKILHSRQDHGDGLISTEDESYSGASDKHSGEQESAESERSFDPESSNSSEGEENAPGTGKHMPSRVPASNPSPLPVSEAEFQPQLAVRLTPGEKIYVRKVMDSTADFTKQMQMKAIKTALKNCGLLEDLNQFLTNVENEMNDLSKSDNQVAAAISLRKLCWEFQQMLQQKLSNSKFSPQSKEVAATVLEVVNQWGVKQNNLSTNVQKREREVVAYIKNIFGIAISLDSKFKTDNNFRQALSHLHLSQPWEKIAPHLATARMFDVDTDYDDGSLIEVSNEIRRELQDFKEVCKKQIEQYANAGEQWVETREIVGNFIDAFDIPEKDLDDLEDMEIETYFGVNANPYILPESLFLNTKYY